MIDSSIEILIDKTAKLQSVIDQLESQPDAIDPDDAVCASNPVYNQLVCLSTCMSVSRMYLSHNDMYLSHDDMYLSHDDMYLSHDDSYDAQRNNKFIILKRKNLEEGNMGEH